MQRAERLLDLIQGLRRRRRPVTAETLASELDGGSSSVEELVALASEGAPAASLPGAEHQAGC